MRPRRLALALSAILMLATCAACSGSASLSTPTRVAAPPSPLFVALDDGSVLEWGPDPASARRVIDREAFLPTLFGETRELAFDPVTRLLWYSDDHSRIVSLHVDTLEHGPQLGGFSDVALLGCSVNGRPRTLAIDEVRRLLLVPQLTGAVLEYHLDGLELAGVISSAAFDEPTLGAFRRIVVDHEGQLWVASATGGIVEVEPHGVGGGGRTLSLDATPRALASDGRGRLLALMADGWMLALDLESLGFEVLGRLPSVAGDAHAEAG